MGTAFPILTACFSGMLLLYAGVLALTRDPLLIPRSYAAKNGRTREYAARFARVIAIVACAPAAAAAVSLFTGNAVGAAVLIAGLVLCIWIGSRQMREFL